MTTIPGRFLAGLCLLGFFTVAAGLMAVSASLLVTLNVKALVSAGLIGAAVGMLLGLREILNLDVDPAHPRPRRIGRFERAAGHLLVVDPGEQPGPIPEYPPHVCPTCRYNLTGLVSRRCPECGEPFSVVDARRAARSEESAADLLGLRSAAVLLLVIIVATGLIVMSRLSRLGFVSPSATLMTALVGVLLLLVARRWFRW